ncbi:flagellar hook-associated protein 1 FlgK [Carnobacterium iners]|uniref:Flagellar hook-associated protein 1 n=1 Tax=Carnobacterium iners TaxID=1073423 RepID=A0A1X7MZZ7_9LACT|nr:flagellar hook-associated protein FlgK [Carnobacterium iners]SEK21447.1 flagellar hook-associated protein 1 FlgK [Carnobacterium iners]SMH30557.1 flagellar hook-associated protein 1 FlgK [Carnobacterium iners]
MSGLFGILNNSSKALNVQQSALQTTSHNVANANTEGYSRQKVNMVAENPYTVSGIGQLGTGVRISSVVRIVDPYVNNQLRNENSSLEMHKQKSDVLGQLEVVFNEPSETGLNKSISQVFSSWTHLASNPELAAAKTMVVQNSENFTDNLHHMSNQIEKLYDGTVKSIEKDVLDFNAKVGQLSSLNKQIFNVAVKGESPNDLLDQQDKILGELAGITGVEASYDKFNRISITVGGEQVLNGNSIKTLGTSSDSVGGLVVNQEGGEKTAIAIKTGSIKGSQEALVEIDNKKQDLNDLAFNFATAVNTIHSDNKEGIPFFDLDSTKDGNYASSITVNSVILNDVTKINAGKNIKEGEVVGGDGTRAQAIASLQNTLLGDPKTDIKYNKDTMSITNVVGGSTVSGAYNNTVTEMGIVKQQADNMAESQEGLVSLLKARRESISGVSINEEVADTMKYQTAFQANSRIISVVSEMLDTLINRTGV